MLQLIFQKVFDVGFFFRLDMEVVLINKIFFSIRDDFVRTQWAESDH